MEENNNGQGFWVESNFEPNPNYQPKRKQRKTSDKEAGSRSNRQAQQLKSQAEGIQSRLNGVLTLLTTFFPRLSGIMSLGNAIVSFFGGLGKLLKRGCLILIIGIIVIIALLWGIGTCMGIDDDGNQVKAVADSTIVESEPVAEPEPIAEPEPEAPEVEEQQMEEPEVAEPEIEEPEVEEPEVVEPVKPVEEPKPQQQAKPKPHKRTNTQEPQKKKGYGFKLEKVDHIPRPE